MTIKRGMTHSLPMRMISAHRLPVNVFEDDILVASDKVSTGNYTMKGFEHTPGGVTCTGISLPLAYYGANSDAAEDKGQTFEACIGDAIEDGIKLSRASSGKVLLHHDQPGRTCTEGVIYTREGATDPRLSDPKELLCRLLSGQPKPF